MTAPDASTPSLKPRTSESMPRPTSEPWLNTASACDHLSISVPTMRRWIKAKKISPKRTPTGEYRFRRSELDALLG